MKKSFLLLIFCTNVFVFNVLFAQSPVAPPPAQPIPPAAVKVPSGDQEMLNDAESADPSHTNKKRGKKSRKMMAAPAGIIPSEPPASPAPVPSPPPVPDSHTPGQGRR